MNLIYGPNETGKTYLVEAILRLLFTQGRKAEFAWKLRSWSASGRVVLAGVGPEPVAFEGAGLRLDEILRDTREGLPPGLSQLLVVKAGDAMLDPGATAGISEEFLKNHLSGEGLIDAIEARVSATLAGANVVNGVIEGHARGELKNRTRLLEERNKLDHLLEKIDQSQGMALLESLTARETELDGRLEELEEARRFRAGVVDRRIQELKSEIARLPDDAETQALQDKVTKHSADSGRKSQKEGELSKLTDTVEDCDWAEHALRSYSALIDAGPKGATGRTYLWLTAALAAIAIILGVAGYSIPLVVAGLAAVVSGSLYVRAQGLALKAAGKSSELERLQAEFKERFGQELTSGAVMESKVEALKEERAKARVLEEDVRTLASDLAGLDREIQAELRAMGAGGDLQPSAWPEVLAGIRGRVAGTRNRIQPLEQELASLKVNEARYLDTDPGTEWDLTAHEQAQAALSQLKSRIQEVTESLADLRSRVQQETGTTVSDWGGMVHALQERRDQVQTEYRELTADILAKIALYATLDDFRSQESERIREGLAREEIRQALEAVGGRYGGLRRDEKGGLQAISLKNEPIPLGDLSSGAQEQVFFALRVGFASMALDGDPAFLILDDAFQHSDWTRRETLVRTTRDLVDHGWQVFYFTMDDHLRDLFLSVGKGLEGEFITRELAG